MSAASTPLARPRILVGAALAVALWAGALPAESVPPMQRRLQISIDYLRQAGTQQGADTARGKLAQQLVLNAVLHSDGRPMIDNPLDPEDGRRQAGVGSEPTDQDEVVETPYLHFSGRATCGLDLTTQVDERIEGSFQDVHGTVPFTQTTQAGQRLCDDASCPVVQAVLDQRNGRLWTNIQMALRDAPGVTVRGEKGRSPQRTKGPVNLHWHEAGDWISQRLLNLSAAGEDQARIPAGAGVRKDGQVEVKLRWRFEAV